MSALGQSSLSLFFSSKYFKDSCWFSYLIWYSKQGHIGQTRLNSLSLFPPYFHFPSHRLWLAIKLCWDPVKLQWGPVTCQFLSQWFFIFPKVPGFSACLRADGWANQNVCMCVVGTGGFSLGEGVIRGLSADNGGRGWVGAPGIWKANNSIRECKLKSQTSWKGSITDGNVAHPCLLIEIYQRTLCPKGCLALRITCVA